MMGTSIYLSTNALLSSAAALIMFVIWRTRKTYPGFVCWVTGIAGLALGAALLIPDLLPQNWAIRILRNALLVGGMMLILRGMLLFRGYRIGYWLEAWVTALFLVIFGYFSVEPANLGIRIVIYSLFAGTLSLATVLVVLHRRPDYFGSNDILLAIWLSVYSGLTYVRGLHEFVGLGINTAFEVAGSFGSYYALAQILSVQLITLTLLSMNSQRIEAQYRESEARLRLSEEQIRSIGDNLPEGFVYQYQIEQGQQRFNYVSDGVESILGLKPEQVEADPQRLFSLMAADSLTRYYEDEARSARDLTVYYGTLCLEHPMGYKVWLDVRSRPQRTAGDRIIWNGVAINATDRLRAEENQRIFKAIIDSSEDAIISKTPRGIVTSWNRSAERIFGYTAEEAVGQSIDLIIPFDRQEEEHAILDRVMLGQAIEHFETIRRHKNGHLIDISVSISPVVDSLGRIVGAAKIARDITEQVEPRIRSMRQSRFYRCLSECNAAVARCTSQQELFETVCRAVIDAAGMPLAWIGLADGAGNLVVAAQAGPACDFLKGLSFSINAQCPSGTAVRTGTPIWCQDFQSDPLTQPWHERGKCHDFHSSASLPIRRGDAVVGALSIYAAERNAFDEETEALLLDLSANISFALDNLERERARLLAEHALHTHRQHLEEVVKQRTRELAEARERAESANLAKSAFLANMSHEIRTPLNAMMGMAHLIRKAGLSLEQNDRMRKLESAATHLLEILNAILDLSKIDAGKLTLEEIAVQIESSVANVVAMLVDRANAKQLRLVSEVGAMPENLVGDPTRLQQALLNYASNAIKFTERGSVTIRVGLLEEDVASALIRFEVEDSGIGIDAEALDRLFSAFEQADRSTTRKSGGTGLGLAITRRLAELMGGSAGVRSAPGSGSLFWFTARLRKQEQHIVTPMLAGEQAAQAIRSRHGGCPVLVAEDNEINAEVARALLEDVGLLVDIASDGVQAVDMATRTPYRLVLMDMQMPNMDGLDACRAIRRTLPTSRLPIIAMTANAFAEDKARCLDAGMDDFASKPVDPKRLYAMLLHWLDKTAESPARS